MRPTGESAREAEEPVAEGEAGAQRCVTGQRVLAPGPLLWLARWQALGRQTFSWLPAQLRGGRRSVLRCENRAWSKKGRDRALRKEERKRSRGPRSQGEEISACTLTGKGVPCL